MCFVNNCKVKFKMHVNADPRQRFFKMGGGGEGSSEFKQEDKLANCDNPYPGWKGGGGGMAVGSMQIPTTYYNFDFTLNFLIFTSSQFYFLQKGGGQLKDFTIFYL